MQRREKKREKDLLELNLNTKINVKTSYFEEESLGTIFFNLEK